MNGTDLHFEIAAVQSSMAKPLHPEDIRVGDQVAIWRISVQCASFLWCGIDLSMWPPDEPIRITYLPFGDLMPMVVKSICIPFVLCKHQDRTSHVYDMRQVEFARLSPSFSESVKQALKAEKKRRKRKEKTSTKKKSK